MESSVSRTPLRNRLFIIMAVSVFAILSWLGILDIASAKYIDGSIVQASIAFASARALNAAVSVAQSTEVSVMVASVGFGEVLDPINDLVEQYSTLMKYAIASLFAQKLLLAITSNLVFKILLTAVGVLAVVAVIRTNSRTLAFALRSFVFLVFLRFALVLVVLLNGLVSHFFLNAQIENDIAEIQGVAEKVADTSEVHAMDPELKAQLESRLENLEAERVKRVEQEARVASELVRKNDELLVAQEKLGAIEQSLDFAQRLNFLDRDQDHAAAIAKRDKIAEEVETLSDRLSELEYEILQHDKEFIGTANTLAGKANNWLEAVGNATGEIAGGVKEKFTAQIGSLVEKSNESVVVIMNMMASFLLKTLVLPLIFLYMTLLLTKAIWNVDFGKIGQTDLRSDMSKMEEA